MDLKIAKRFIGLIFFFFPLFLLGQSKKMDCSNIRKGTFYFYPLGSKMKFAVVRTDSIQKEINLLTADTSFWRVSWQDDCMFNMKFIRKSHPISDDERAFYDTHTLFVKVLRVMKRYYIFEAGIDPAVASRPRIDTLWFKER